jgi:hypothetical protein
MDAGFGSKLMLDWWEGDSFTDGEDIEIVAPAKKGCEGSTAHADPHGCCTLLTKDKKCAVHDVAKPLEGAVAFHDNATSPKSDTVKKAIVTAWMTPKGKAVLSRWKKDHWDGHERSSYSDFW